VLVNDEDVDDTDLTAQRVADSGPHHGTLTFGASGWFDYYPASDYHGLDSFAYRVWDGEAYSEPVTVSLTITSVNDVPVASDDSYTVNMNSLLRTYAHDGVLLNDIDADNYDDDPDNDDNLSVSLVSDASHGVLSLGATGWLEYRPHKGYFGEDSFTYRVSDGESTSEIATVKIEVLPRFPGDADRNTVVDKADAAILASNWGKTDMTWDDGDFNGDGRVDLMDAAILAAHFGSSFAEEASVAPVPSDSEVFIGPLPVEQAAGTRRLIEPAPERETAAEESAVAEGAGCVAARDAALAEQYGPAIDSGGVVRRELAWSSLLSRRTVRRDNDSSGKAEMLAVDLSLTGEFL
jgi:hypothetical protein